MKSAIVIGVGIVVIFAYLWLGIIIPGNKTPPTPWAVGTGK